LNAGVLRRSIFLHIEGEDRRKLPIEIRRAELDGLVAGVDAITFSEQIDAEGAVVFAKACEMGLEGIVSKRLGGVYRSGRELGEDQEPGFPETMIRSGTAPGSPALSGHVPTAPTPESNRAAGAGRCLGPHQGPWL
jgi:hypothetical protein